MKNKKSSIKNPFLILFTLTLGIYLGKYLAVPNQYIQISNSGELPKLVELLNYLEFNYVDAIDLDSLQEEVIAATLESLDPHSSYIPIDELQDITESMQGNFEGIGVQFQIIRDTIVVISPISGGPSQRKGIQAGDKIVKVDTMNVAGVGFTNKDVLKTLKADKGTKVLLFIKRKNVDRLLEFNITRDKIPITSVDVSYMVNDQVGYIKVNRFSGTTEEEFISALDGLKSKGMKKLILDLRSNPGGYLSSAINMVDEFLPNGKTVVYTEGAFRNKQIYKSTNYGRFKKEKLPDVSEFTGFGESLSNYLERNKTWMATKKKNSYTMRSFRHGYSWITHKITNLSSNEIAKHMGHTEETHIKHYTRWFSEEDLDASFKKGMKYIKKQNEDEE